jgi:hypothetical protein
MIKFFRRIRYDILGANKTGRYFKYAIGEIILVMVGILLALQVNTWNENRLNKKTEKKYLSGIIANLDKDIEELKRLISRDTLQLQAQTTILKSFRDEKIRNDIPELVGAIARFQGITSFSGNNIVFEDMKSSGKINLIASDTLRFNILDYYEAFESLKRKETFNNNITIQLKDPISMAYLDPNSIYETNSIPDLWKSEVNKLDLSFFERNIDSPEVTDFANKISSIKAMLIGNHRSKRRLSRKAMELKKQVISYIEE